MRYLPLFFLCLLFPTTIFTQLPFTVISNSGLKLRTAPDQNSRVLAVAPFGATVQVLSDKKSRDGQVIFDPPARRDAIGELFPLRYNSPAAQHIGYWWPVRYAGKSGYMFSGFLADSAMLHTTISGELNNHFRLRTTGGNVGASNAPEFDANWYWYGVFPQADGRFELKKTTPRYAVEDLTDSLGNYEIYPNRVVIQVDPPTKPAFLIGTRKPWKERSGFEGFWVELAQLEQYDQATGSVNPAFLKKYQIEVLKENVVRNGQSADEVLSWFITNQNGQKQRVLPLTLHGDFQLYPSALAWAGDLDGDGKLDYIFNADGEIGYALLYLSSQAKAGEIARPVAVLWNWYTC